jgi:hypothetical protein
MRDRDPVCRTGYARGRYLGDRYFDQRIRKRRCPSEIRVDARAESVHRAFPSARVSPISQGCDDNPCMTSGLTFAIASKLRRSLKIPNSASLADVPCERILWVDDHHLLAGVMQLSRQIAIAGIEERVTLRRDHVEGVFRLAFLCVQSAWVGRNRSRANEDKSPLTPPSLPSTTAKFSVVLGRGVKTAIMLLR